MLEDHDKEIVKELKEVINGKYYSYALELFSQLIDQDSEKSLMIKKDIYEGYLKEYKNNINYKLKELLKQYVEKKNFRLLKLELELIEQNLKYLESIVHQVDPEDIIHRKYRLDINPWKKLHEDFNKFKAEVKQKIEKYWEEYKTLIEEAEKDLEEKQKERKIGTIYRKVKQKIKEKREKNEKLEIDVNKPKVELLLEMHKPENDENYIEYLPFMGITSVRLRVLVNQPIKKLILKPKLMTNMYAENIEWSSYICGMNNENTEHNLTKGFIALFGGGKTEGFVMHNPPAESYAFFFLRHHDKKLKGEIDFSITFEAIEEISEKEQNLLASITVPLKYPNDIRPKTEKELPDEDDPKCPIHAVYRYDYKKRGLGLVLKEKFREITFKGNMIPDYYPRWWPPQVIKYHPIIHKDKISNLVIKITRLGFTHIYYKFNGDLHEIAELKGRLTPAVFHDPLLMTTAEVFRFFSDDFIVLRIYFWWIDLRMNDKRWRMNHEMPDFERVDFVIDLRNPNKKNQMIPFIATDVHWKEFWLDTRNVKGSVKVKFTPIGVDMINWKQLVAYFSHHEGIIYHSLPAIIHELFSWIGDNKPFFCVACRKRTEMPKNVPALREIIDDLSEEAESKRIQKIVEEMSDIMCPSCGKLFTKEEKLQYMFFFEDYSKFKKKLKEDILDDALAAQIDEEATEGGGQPLSLKRQNCHVPTPAGGVTSKDWCSSTVIKPLSLKRITYVKEYEKGLDKTKVIGISDLEGINQKYIIRLAPIGIIKLKDLITANIDDVLSKIDFSGLSEQDIKFLKENLPKWQRMAELYQIEGIDSQYAQLLVDIGENLQSLKKYDEDPSGLINKIETHNETNNDMRRIPSIEEVANWIEQANTL
ncbi:MAG: DUF4332 domain-containing protein [Candidatus Helarchaeota archaeon]